MVRNIVAISFVAGALFVAGCSHKPAATTGRQATITLTDGSGFAGTISKSSTDSLTVVAPNGESRTYPMSQVASIQYSPGTATTASNPAPNTPPPQAVPEASNAQPAPTAAQTSPAPTTAQSTPPPAPAPSPAPAPRAESAPVEITRTIPAGAHLVVRNNDTIDSKRAAPGEAFSAVVEEPVADTAGRLLIPRGSPATLVVRNVRENGAVEGRTGLALDIDGVTIHGRRYHVETNAVDEKGRAGVGANGRTGKFVGGGAILGTLLGAVAGGGRGAGIGALSGAAAGVATQTFTRGHVKVPAETLMTFRLEAPIHVRQIR